MFANKTHKTPFFSCHNSHNFLAYPTRMRILYLALLILIFNTPVAFGAGCADATKQTSCDALAGCEFINNTCTPCKNGYYKGQNSDLCDECPNGYDYTKITDGVGATEMKQCYKFCTERTENGTIYKPASVNEYYPNACAYTISCVVKAGNPCSSYYLNANQCLPRWEKDIKCDNGINEQGVRIIQDDGASKNYCTLKTICDTNFHFEPDSNAPNCIFKNETQATTLGQCVSNKQLCAKLAVTCDGTILGDATWNGNTYDLSECTCTTTKETDLGVLETTCSHSATENKWINCESTITECIAGHWASPDKKDDCSKVGNGYYSVADDTDRQKCPAGSTTSTTTAASNKDCHMTGGTTQICDNDNKNCLTLPEAAGKIYYRGAQQ